MSDAQPMQIPYAYDYLGCIELRHLFSQIFLLLEYPVQLTPSDERHYKVQSQFTLENELERTQERIVTLEHHVHLIFGVLNDVFFNQLDFLHGFDGVEFWHFGLVIFQVGKVDLTERSFADDAQEVEILE